MTSRFNYRSTPSRFSRSAFGRVWLLALWPYLLWSLFGAAPHFHNADGSELTWRNTAAFVQSGAHTDVASTPASLSENGQSHDFTAESANCLLCHWNSFSAQRVANVAFQSTDCVTAPLFRAPSSHAAFAAVRQTTNRGPPLV